ncbi:Uncharacterized protein Rs2_10961 [Raphanus sativus]|nr:Uncharacterized protein Rs2_10961 [Raphanus sativus]
MKKRGVGRPIIPTATHAALLFSSDANPPVIPYAEATRNARQLRLSIRRQRRAALSSTSVSTTAKRKIIELCSLAFYITVKRKSNHVSSGIWCHAHRVKHYYGTPKQLAVGPTGRRKSLVYAARRGV